MSSVWKFLTRARLEPTTLAFGEMKDQHSIVGDASLVKTKLQSFEQRSVLHVLVCSSKYVTESMQRKRRI